MSEDKPKYDWTGKLRELERKHQQYKNGEYVTIEVEVPIGEKKPDLYKEGCEILILASSRFGKTKYQNETREAANAFLALIAFFYWHHRGYVLKRDGWHLPFAKGDKAYSVYQFSRIDGVRQMDVGEAPF